MKKNLFLIIIFLTSILTLSHPHVFVDINTTITTKDNNITSVSFQWTYDELFSGAIISDYDKDHNNIFSESEKEELKKSIFNNMESYDYYTFFYIDNKRIKIKPIFDAKISETNLVFTFTFKKNIPYSKYVKLLVYDEEYFHSMEWKQLSIKGNSKENLKHSFSQEEIMLSFYPVEIEVLHLGEKKDDK